MAVNPAILTAPALKSCELELMLRWEKDYEYTAHLRFTRPEDDTDIRMVDTATVVIDPKQLALLKGDTAAYGRKLWALVFECKEVSDVVDRAYGIAQDRQFALRLRLFISNNAPELHSVWWETLIDPQTDSPLLMREDVVFSRYLDSSDWRPLTPVRARRLKVLAVIANPGDIGRYDRDGGVALEPLDMERELAMSRLALANLDVELITDTGPATLSRIIERLRDRFDVLYLVCHGALFGAQPRLYLETEEGKTAVVPGEDLAARLRDMADRPRLVVLASCQSAGTGHQTSVADDGALAALGPRLLEAGVPAVVAMQGNITMGTVEKFMPELFAQLQRHGQIDRAMAIARGCVRERRDWWMPVLFMRLRGGALWYESSGAQGTDPQYNWDGLLEDLGNGDTVMVLGTGLSEAVLGSTRDIAGSWADHYCFPMAPQKRDDLQQVTQYLAYSRNRTFPLSQLRKYLIQDLRRRHAPLLKDFPLDAEQADYLDALIRQIGNKMRENQAGEPQPSTAPALPYSMLARLPVTTYVTTNRDNLLFDSLVAEGRRPRIVVGRWRPLEQDDADIDVERWPVSAFEEDPAYRPTVQEPLIFYVFGNMSFRHTVVLTEDDYFDFLVGFTRNQNNPRTSMPPYVRRALASNGLVFLGFHFEDWEFRTLFRGVLPREGNQSAMNHSSVAVQIEPGDGRMAEPVAARAYLTSYFNRNRHIQTYWGTSDDFLKELTKRWKQTRQA